MTNDDSLLLRAKRLTAVARAKRDNAADVQAAGQFATALNKLANYFPELETQLRNRAALAKAGAKLPATPDLRKAPDKLREHIADIGRPSPQFLTSRSTDVAATIKSLQIATDVAWKDWSRAQVDSLGIDPTTLTGHRGQEVLAELAELEQAVVKSFSSAALTLFKLQLGIVKDLLEALGSPITPDDVIARLEAARGSLTLADLTHEEIEALRHAPDRARRVRLSVR